MWAKLGFWTLILLFFHWGIAFVRIVINPNWYFMSRALAGHDVPETTTRVLVIKAIETAAVGWAIWLLGGSIGYW